MSELTSSDLNITALAPKGLSVTGQSHILQTLTAKSACSEIVQTTSAKFALCRQKNKASVEITLPKDAKYIAHRSRAFKPVEFDGFRKQAGLNSFTTTAKLWIERTDAIQHMKRLTADERTPKLPEGKKRK